MRETSAWPVVFRRLVSSWVLCLYPHVYVLWDLGSPRCDENPIRMISRFDLIHCKVIPQLCKAPQLVKFWVPGFVRPWSAKPIRNDAEALSRHRWLKASLRLVTAEDWVAEIPGPQLPAKGFLCHIGWALLHPWSTVTDIHTLSIISLAELPSLCGAFQFGGWKWWLTMVMVTND